MVETDEVKNFICNLTKKKRILFSSVNEQERGNFEWIAKIVLKIVEWDDINLVPKILIFKISPRYWKFLIILVLLSQSICSLILSNRE